MQAVQYFRSPDCVVGFLKIKKDSGGMSFFSESFLYMASHLSQGIHGGPVLPEATLLGAQYIVLL